MHIVYWEYYDESSGVFEVQTNSRILNHEWYCDCDVNTLYDEWEPEPDHSKKWVIEIAQFHGTQTLQ